MNPRFLFLNALLLLFAFAASRLLIHFVPGNSHPLGYIAEILIHFVVVTSVSVMCLVTVFGRRVFLSNVPSPKVLLEEARYMLVTAGVVQVIFPIIFIEGSILYLEFAIGVALVLVYFLKHRWATLVALFLYAAYILAQNYLTSGPIPSTPFLVAILYEVFFLYKVAVTKTSAPSANLPSVAS